MNQASKHLMTAQEVVASALANEDVRVLFDADVPWVDLENRIMHLRPLPDVLTDEAVEDVRSDCDHELGHIRYTDHKVFDEIKRRLVHIIANSIEDGRIERLMAEEWVGCGENLSRSGSRAVQRIAASANDTVRNRRSRAVCGLSLMSFGQPLKEVVQALGTDVESYYAELGALVNDLPKVQTSEECVRLAERIADTWNWGRDARPESVKAVDPVDLEDSAEREDEVAQNLSETTSIAEARKLNLLAIPAKSIAHYRAKTDHDQVETIRSGKINPLDVLTFFNSSVRRVVPTLRRRLLMKFRHMGRHARRHRKRGELDERSLYRHALNDERLFKQQMPSMVQKAHITLLVDCSTSMTNAARDPETPDEPLALRSRLFVAAQAAAALSSALDLLHVRNECLAFTTSRSPVKAKAGFERVRPLRHLIVKPFNRSYYSCRANFVSLGLYEHCSENIDGEAVLWAAQRLIKASKSDARRILIVLSDGEPASNPEDSRVLAHHLLTSITRVERCGVDVIGLGIGTAADSVRRYYRRFMLVRDVSGLVEQVYKLTESLLQESVAPST